MSLTSSLSYLTRDLPGIGGVIKLRPEDFLVEEQPLYEPCGEGEYLYLYVEKTSLTTSEMVRRLAKAFRVAKNAIGYAGMKDKHAVTRQHFSVWLPDLSEQADALERLGNNPRANVLWTDRHLNKLRRGHLASNRFVIRIRGVKATDALKARRVLERLVRTGIPNFIGEQRFGYRQNSHVLGRLLLLGEHMAFLDQMLGHVGETDSEHVRAGRDAYERGDYAAALESWPRQLRFDRQALDGLRQGRSAEKAVRMIDRSQREFLVSALQGAVFNAVLERRLQEHRFDRLLPGDLAWKHDSREVFAVDEQTAAIENGPAGRVAKLEVSPSGPLWGTQMERAQGEPGKMEHQALLDHGLTEEQLEGVADITSTGRRRSLRAPLKDYEISGGVDEQGAFVRVAFELPRGVYATVLLREVMKIGELDRRRQEAATARKAKVPGSSPGV